VVGTRCRVSYLDSRNIEHAVDVTADSLFEAAAVAATSGALKQTQYQYQGGIVTYLQIVVTENAALSARISAAEIQIRRMNATVLLVKALGGGWKASGGAKNCATLDELRCSSVTEGKE